jgi:hypothetical protein
LAEHIGQFLIEHLGVTNFLYSQRYYKLVLAEGHSPEYWCSTMVDEVPH